MPCLTRPPVRPIVLVAVLAAGIALPAAAGTLTVNAPGIGAGHGSAAIADAVSGIPNTPATTTFYINMNIADPNYILGDVDVTLVATHPAINELKIVLVSPNAISVTLLRNRTDASGVSNPNAGASGADFFITVFDQEASTSILNNGTNQHPGRFRPDGGTLASFYGLTAAQASGLWQLQITDYRAGNVGVLDSIDLNLNSLGPVEGMGVSGVVALFTDSDVVPAANFSALIDWGDGFASTGVIHSYTGGFDVTGSHVYAEDGMVSCTVTVHDALDNQNGMTTFGLLVADAPLTAAGVTTSRNCKAFSGLVATFTDADPNGVAGDFTATIDWGDLTAATPGVVSANVMGGFDVNGTHPYASNGSYLPGVHIADLGGSTATAGSSIGINPDSQAPAVTSPAAAIVRQTLCQ